MVNYHPSSIMAILNEVILGFYSRSIEYWSGIISGLPINGKFDKFEIL